MRRFVLLTTIAVFGILAAAAAAEPTYHVLEKGETLYSLSRKYNLPYEAIAFANGITDPGKLKAGQKILIPVLHRVEKGETLFGIAKEFGTTIEELCRTNKLDAKAVIKPGDILAIPVALLSKSGIPQSPNPVSTAGSNSKQTAPVPGVAVPPSPPIIKTSAKAIDTKLSWPCKGETVYLDGKLYGVMIRTSQGEPSIAVASGSVVSAGPYRGFGQVIFVQSKNGLIYVYGGNESLSVVVGDHIRSGQVLGRVGIDQKEGRALGYFFVFKEGEALDPAKAPRE